MFCRWRCLVTLIDLSPISPHPQVSGCVAHQKHCFRFRASTDLHASALLPYLHLIGGFISVVSHLDRSALLDVQTAHSSVDATDKSVIFWFQCLKFFLDFAQCDSAPSGAPLFWLAERRNWPTFDRRGGSTRPDPLLYFNNIVPTFFYFILCHFYNNLCMFIVMEYN